MGKVVPLQPDTFRPASFDITPYDAMKAKGDREIAFVVLEWAQQKRMATLQGPLPAEDRAKLLCMLGVVRGHPEP